MLDGSGRFLDGLLATAANRPGAAERQDPRSAAAQAHPRTAGCRRARDQCAC
ncbi:MAG: hypothetical protein MZW92_26675 [Comamonadaceae bacterium]|nr:hypothetical protein [Comamonadaceae bacterium]